MRKAHNSKLKTQNSKLNIAHRATIQNSKLKTQNRLRRQFKTQNSKFKTQNMRDFKDIKIAVAGTGYVGLSIATLLSQHHHVTAVDVIPEKVEKLNNKISPIQDDYI